MPPPQKLRSSRKTMVFVKTFLNFPELELAGSRHVTYDARHLSYLATVTGSHGEQAESAAPKS